MLSGPQWHVIYALASDAADRFASLGPKIVADAAAIDAWWQREDPTRTIRFDLAAFPGCTSRLGRLDLTFVRLPQAASVYQSEDPPNAMRVDLRRLGFDSANKKYLVFYDGPVNTRGGCGVVAGNFLQYAYRYLGVIQSPQGPIDCRQDIGAGGHAAAVTAHEMTHALGVVRDVYTPPNACPGDEFHVCDDARDLMYGRGFNGQGLETRILDVGRNDYYAHAGSFPDVQDSPFLAAPSELAP